MLILPFLVPGPAILFWLGQSGRLPEWVVGAWWWQGIVLAHQAWLVLALGVAMTVEMARSSRGGGPSPAAG